MATERERWVENHPLLHGPGERSIDFALIDPIPDNNRSGGRTTVTFSVSTPGKVLPPEHVSSYEVEIRGMLVPKTRGRDGGKTVTLFGRVSKINGYIPPEQEWFVAVRYNTHFRKGAIFTVGNDLEQIREAFAIDIV